jgi:hypothetical protein
LPELAAYPSGSLGERNGDRENQEDGPGLCMMHEFSRHIRGTQRQVLAVTAARTFSRYWRGVVPNHWRKRRVK